MHCFVCTFGLQSVISMSAMAAGSFWMQKLAFFISMFWDMYDDVWTILFIYMRHESSFFSVITVGSPSLCCGSQMIGLLEQAYLMHCFIRTCGLQIGEIQCQLWHRGDWFSSRCILCMYIHSGCVRA